MRAFRRQVYFMDLFQVDDARTCEKRASTYGFTLFLVNTYFVTPSRNLALLSHTSPKNALEPLDRLHFDVADDVARVCHGFNIIDQSTCPLMAHKAVAPEKPLLLPAIIGALVQQSIWRHTGILISSVTFSKWFCYAFNKPVKTTLAKYWMRASHYIHCRVVRYNSVHARHHVHTANQTSLYQNESLNQKPTRFRDRCDFILSTQSQLIFSSSSEPSFLWRAWRAFFASLTRDCFPSTLVNTMDEELVFRNAISSAHTYISDYCTYVDGLRTDASIDKHDWNTKRAHNDEHRVHVETLYSISASEVVAVCLFLALRKGCATYLSNHLDAQGVLVSPPTATSASTLLHQLAQDIALALRYTRLTEAHLSLCVDAVSDVVLGAIAHETKRAHASHYAREEGDKKGGYMQCTRPVRVSIIEQTPCAPKNTNSSQEINEAYPFEPNVSMRMSECVTTCFLAESVCSRFIELMLLLPRTAVRNRVVCMKHSAEVNGVRSVVSACDVRCEGTVSQEYRVIALGANSSADRLVDSVYINSDSEKQRKRQILGDVCALIQHA